MFGPAHASAPAPDQHTTPHRSLLPLAAQPLLQKMKDLVHIGLLAGEYVQDLSPVFGRRSMSHAKQPDFGDF